MSHVPPSSQSICKANSLEYFELSVVYTQVCLQADVFFDSFVGAFLSFFACYCQSVA